MSWSKISSAGGLASPECRWIRTVFQHLYETASARDYDELALYAGRDHRTLYVSPKATLRLETAATLFGLVGCERPDDADVVLLLGDLRASSPSWCERTFEERRADEEVERLDREAA